MNLVTVISTAIKETRRLIKFSRLGTSDVRERYEVSPYGFDSNPIEKMVALYAETGVIGQSVIIGYINVNQVADVGEMRLYSTDADGAEQIYAWLKNDGTMELGGDADNMVRFSKLEEAYNQLKDDHDALVQTFNNHIHITTATIGVGGPGSIAPTTTTENPSSGNIAPAKIDEIKTS